MHPELIDKLRLIPQDYAAMGVDEQFLLDLPITEQDLTKIFLMEEPVRDSAIDFAQQVVSVWSRNGWGIQNGANPSVYILTPGNGGPMVARSVVSAFEEHGYSVTTRYTRAVNYTAPDQIASFPILEQRLDPANEDDLGILLLQGKSILTVDEIFDSGRTSFLVNIYLTSLISATPFEVLYRDYVLPLADIPIGDPQEELLVEKLKDNVPEYKIIQSQSKWAVMHRKDLDPRPRLVQPDYVGEVLPPAWYVYRWEHSMDTRQVEAVIYLADIYQERVLEAA